MGKKSNSGYDLWGLLAIFLSNTFIPIVQSRAYHLLRVEEISPTCTRRPLEMSKAPVRQCLLHDEVEQKDEANQPHRAVVWQFQFHGRLHLQSLFSVQHELIKREDVKIHRHKGIATSAAESDKMTCRCIRRGRGTAKRTSQEKKSQAIVSRMHTFSSPEPAC